MFPDTHTRDEYFDAVTVTLGELVEDGVFDEDAEEWSWRDVAVDDEQYKRVCGLFKAKYWYREVGVLPIFRFQLAYVTHMRLIMPKYKRLYAILAKDPNVLSAGDSYEKSRDIFSEFPETLLSGNSDYVSTGSDRESERVEQGDFVEQLDKFVNRYRDVDAIIVDELGFLFSSLLTSTVPMF